MSGIMTVPLMQSTVEGAAPDPQKNVLAVLAAYNEATGGPMPWSLLLFAMQTLQESSDEVALGSPYNGAVERALYHTVSNLQLLNLVHSGPNGTEFTHPGEGALKAWNGSFTARKKKAREALLRINLLQA